MAVLDLKIMDSNEDRLSSSGGSWSKFGRVVRLMKRHRRMLVLGLVATVVFAMLHTVSIAAVFPVFTVILEEEGLQNWVEQTERTMAGDRVGLEFAVPEEEDTGKVMVQRVKNSTGASTSIAEKDYVLDLNGRPIDRLLHDMSSLEPGKVISALVETDGVQRPVTFTGVKSDFVDGTVQSLMRFGIELLPKDLDTPDGKLRTLVRLLVGLVLVVLIANVFRFIGEVFISMAVFRAMMDVRAILYYHTLHLPMSFFATMPTADLVTRFVQDVQEVQRGLQTFFGKFIREPLKAALILGLAFIFDWRITLTMVVVVPVTVGIFWAVGRSVKRANFKLLKHYGEMVDALTTSLQNLRIVKTYTAEDQERKRLSGVDWRMFRQQIKLAKLQAFVSPAIETMAVMAASCVTVWLASRVLAHELTIPKFVQLGVTLGMLFDPLRKLTDVYVRVKRSTAGADRIFQVLEHPTESDSDTAHISVSALQKSIDFTNVSLTYPGAAEPALKNVNLSIAKGETVAIVGPNGSGKTTLVSLLPRLLVPNEGEIRYDDTLLQDADLRELRRQIGVVSQEAIVFAGTPLENITYGYDGEPDRDRAQDAAKRAYADEFISNLPGGYDSQIGERGTTLSGGQRQRLAIARAIFHNAPILIFDEATSQVDSESEQKIQEALRAFSKDRTTLIIAHRLSTIQFANRIVVMDRGEIIDAGNHKELYQRCTLYRTLCDTQFGRDADL